MKKILIIFGMLAFGLSSFCQLKVANNFGKDIYVSINNKEELIPNKGIKTFANMRVHNVWLDCRSVDETVKFSVSKEVSRSGLVEISSNDYLNNTTTTVPVTTTYSSNSMTTESSNGPSLDQLLKGTGSPTTSYVSETVSNSPTTSYTSSTVTRSVPVVSSSTITKSTAIQTTSVVTDPINFVYTGNSRFKIFSAIGRGLEFLGSDTTETNSAKNQYNLYVEKNTDLIIGIGLKKGSDQSIWPYAEIRKRINAGDKEVVITENDIKKMSTSENKKLSMRLSAEKYKIFFEPDSGEPISIGGRESSRPVEYPLGQFYIRVSYTDASGMFHRTVFVPKHVTKADRYLEITKADLDNSVQLNW